MSPRQIPSQTRSVETVTAGDVIGTTMLHLTRADLVRYAGASGDLNPIHWDERTAARVGLPGVIAHGMLTMAAVVGLVVDWAGDPAAVVAYGVRFTGQVVVDAEAGADVEVTATVGAVDEQAATARVDIVATSAGTRVLGRARATVALTR